jgi:hypothetical protein
MKASVPWSSGKNFWAAPRWPVLPPNRKTQDQAMSRSDRPLLILLLAVAAALGTYSCRTGGPEHRSGAEPAASPPEDLLLLITGETVGYLEPCGCVNYQLGGLPHRAALCSHLQNRFRNIVAISNGGLFDSAGRQNELKASVMGQALRQMNYRVVNLTERELIFGEPFLRGLFLPLAGIEFVSANFRPAPLADLVEPVRLITVELDGRTFTIGVTGIMEPNYTFGLSVHHPEMPSREALEQALPALREADLRVVLYMGDYFHGRELIEDFPEVDILVTGYEEDAPDDEPAFVGRTLVTKTGFRGKYMVGITVAHSGQPEQQLGYQVYSLDDSLGEDPMIRAMLDRHNEHIAQSNLLEEQARTRPLYGEATYVGTATCRVCHSAEHKIWAATRHGDAFATLHRVRHHRNPECIYCHVVGYPDESGYVNQETTPHLKDVGCENCHGPGSTHAQNMGKKPYGATDLDACLDCHHEEHDPHFHHGKWEAIKHGPAYNELMLEKLRQAVEQAGG